jgi:HEPN domain-containing protein
MRKDSLHPPHWFRIAEGDLQRARNLLALEDLIGAGFNIQQSMEKYLKGYLLSKGWALRRIHDLEALLDDAIAYEPSLEDFRAACQKSTEYYLEERYPGTPESELRREEMQESLASAEGLIEKIKALLG